MFKLNVNIMTLTFYSNFLNHHQVLIADELYRILKDDFKFVATQPKDPKELKGGADFSNRSYCVLAGESTDCHQYAIQLAVNSDVCVFGAFSQEFAGQRAKLNPSGLSFEVGERWLKRGWINVLSPAFRKWWCNYIRYYHKANFHKLCCSAYTSIDDQKVCAYKGRHYKWGYFTSVPEIVPGSNNFEQPDVEASTDVSTAEITPLMWCSRFLLWKHPELPVQMAKKLKEKGYRFQLLMYGDEGLEEKHDGVFPKKKLESMINELGVGDCVRLMGNRPNTEILQAMKASDIFLFTSDRLEGWGAVANESMANGCALVASDAIGSSPYLLEDGFNGFMFESCNTESLTDKVEWLLSHPDKLALMRRNAYVRMRDMWSPRKAAEALFTLIDDLQNGREPSLTEGPCSKA